MNLRNILFVNKLTGSNFMDWVQSLRIILRQEKFLYVLENPIPSEPAPDDDVAIKDAYQKHSDDSESVCCLMSASMSPDLQKQNEDMNVFTMLNHLKALYDKKARNERYDISQELFHCKIEVVPSLTDPILLYCDNNGAIAQAKEPRSHHRSKHILRRYHLIKEIIDRDEVKIEKVHTEENIANPLTKPLSQKKHDSHVFSYGLKNNHNWM